MLEDIEWLIQRDDSKTQNLMALREVDCKWSDQKQQVFYQCWDSLSHSIVLYDLLRFRIELPMSENSTQIPEA